MYTVHVLIFVCVCVYCTNYVKYTHVIVVACPLACVFQNEKQIIYFSGTSLLLKIATFFDVIFTFHDIGMDTFHNGIAAVFEMEWLYACSCLEVLSHRLYSYRKISRKR